jgi:hypothetical protein
MNRHFRFVVLLVLSLFPAVLAAQQSLEPQTGWNGDRVLELVRRAQERRAEAHADTGLLSYQADARAYVYFYLDRHDTGERNLVKTDQVALEVAWQTPDLTKQRIVGWRDQKSLPTNIQYHIDHLAVVLENFGDEIRIGDGDEVGNVLHPAARDAEEFYEYRLADSLTLRLPGAPEPVRVYEIQVRPRDLSQPAFVGSIFVERRAGDLVRMDFTFTPSAYRDRYLDYINISLDNGLWKGRFWLPNQQRIEIRRQLPELDIPAGSVIRGTMRVGNYRFNEMLPLLHFAGAPVTVIPREQRERFPFEEEIHAQLREQGISAEVELREIRRQAAELALGRTLSGVRGVRLQVPGASNVLRYNRAEGATVALGLSTMPRPGLRTSVRAGWAFGAGHPIGEINLNGQVGPVPLSFSAYGNLPRDLGVGPAASGALNTLSTLLAGSDYRDLLYASGAELQARRQAMPGWTLSGLGRAEVQRSAELSTEFSIFGEAADLRPVRPVDEGTMLTAGVSLGRPAVAEAARWWTAALRADVSTLQTEDPTRGNMTFFRPQLRAAWGRRLQAYEAQLEIEAEAGAAWGELPVQALYLLGGRGTVPGYGFRSFGGDRYARASAVVSADLFGPWLQVRGLGAAGWADVGAAGERSLRLWGAAPTGGVRPSLGVGVGILHDILHVDVARGLGREGRWEVIVEARRSFWDFL